MAMVVGGEKLRIRLQVMWTASQIDKQVVFVCIGTDRSTGDSFGPLVGTLLEEAGYPYVVGTLQRPCDSSNLTERLKELPAEALIVAIDCCVGSSVGKFQLAKEPLFPGKFMGKPLPSIGNISLLATVCRNEDNPYRALQTASLYLVMTMAKQAAAAIQEVIPVGRERA